MRNHRFPHQLMFDGFETEFEKWLEADNRWVLLSRIIPWEALSAAYEMSLSAHTGRPAKDGRLVIGAVIIKQQAVPERRADNRANPREPVSPILRRLQGLS